MGDFLIELGQTPRQEQQGLTDSQRPGSPPLPPPPPSWAQVSFKERRRQENLENWKRLEEVERRRQENLENWKRLKSKSSDTCTVMGGRTRRNKKARRKGITRRNKKPRRKGITRRNRIYSK
jgi:hypothetical protein